MKYLIGSIIVLGQIVCIGTMLSSCSPSVSSSFGSQHCYYHKNLKKVVLSSGVNKCNKVSR